MILLMGMAVGVDYSLFYVKRARAERHSGRSKLDAIEIAAETSGHSVLVSGAAVIVSMLGLFLADDVTFASLAAGSIIVVAVAVLGSLTVLPALLVLLGQRHRSAAGAGAVALDDARPRAAPVAGAAAPVAASPGTHAGHRRAVALGAVAVPALGLTLASDSARSLPIVDRREADARSAQCRVPEPSGVRRRRGPRDACAVRAGHRRARPRSPRVSRTTRSSSDAAGRACQRDGTVHVLSVDAPFDAESSRREPASTGCAPTLVPAAVRGIPGAQWAVGGEAATQRRPATATRPTGCPG